MNFRKKAIGFFILSFLISTPIHLSNGENIIYADDNNVIETNAEAIGKTVIPIGKCVGVTLDTDGVVVTGISDICREDGTKHSPAHDAGINSGDIIKKYNNSEIKSVEDLEKEITASEGKSSEIVFNRNGKNICSSITPSKSCDDKKYKIGAWVKDATSGIGTLTFYDPETKYFAALGHGICDKTSGKLIDINGGKLLNSTIVDVTKSQKGLPGELKGVFIENDTVLGNVKLNTESGLCGIISDSYKTENLPVEIATKNQIKKGNAYIYSNIEGNKTERFEIEILRVIPNSQQSSKNMIIKITDPKLLEKTGGIVQGMSGSPIIQNGKLVGAITHVFINDPTRGYGIFIENMLAEAEKISD